MTDAINKKITLDEMRNLQRVAGIMEYEPSSYDQIDIPADLMDAWKRFVEVKKDFNEVLERYNFNKII